VRAIVSCSTSTNIYGTGMHDWRRLSSRGRCEEFL
jgi:hypothetical protein